jgi:hypothetical protein
MLHEIMLVVVSVLVWAGIIYSLLRPKETRRVVKDVLKETAERVKSRRWMRAKTPEACRLCCRDAPATVAERHPSPTAKRNQGGDGRKPFAAKAMRVCVQTVHILA